MSSIRRKEPLDKKRIIKITVLAVVLVIALAFLVMVLRSKVSKEFGSEEENEVQTAQVTKGSISTTISGSGTLGNEEAEEISIPQTVEVTEIYVNTSDMVKEGDMLASVNSASVVEAMNEIQEELDALDEQLAEVSETEAEETIKAGVTGRIKKIYAKKGKAVADIMYKKEALMLISVDGYMAVDVETDTLKKGDSVTVKDSDGTKYTGTVDSVWGGKATVLITDNGTTYNDTVTVSLGDDKTVEGKLYIHECVKVTGYTGTISSVNVSENEKVSEGKSLLYLDDTSNSINYATILEKREELEEELQNLIVIYKEGAVYAQAEGIVTSITEVEDSTVTTTTAASGDSFSGGTGSVSEVSSLEEDEIQDTIIAICPTDKMLMTVSVDETDILSLGVGQSATVSVESLGDDTYTGTVTEIDKTGTSADGVTTYSANIEVERTEGMLEGLSASAVITIEGKEDALLLPEDAVKKTSSTAYVYTSYDEETKEFGDMAEVTIGISNGSYIEITDGLSEGDTVYYQDNEEESGGFGNMPGGMMMPGGGDMPSGGQNMPGGGNMPGGRGNRQSSGKSGSN